MDEPVPTVPPQASLAPQAQPVNLSTASQKWADRPWFAVISALSLCVGIGLSILNILNWASAHREQVIKTQAQLPRLRNFYIEIASTAFEENIAHNTELT